MDEFLISKGVPLIKYGVEFEMLLGNKYQIVEEDSVPIPKSSSRIWVRITDSRSFGFYLEEDHELYYGKYFYTKSELRDIKLNEIL
jgi:hypothetical protein